MVSTETIEEYAEQLRITVANPEWGFTVEEQAEQVAAYKHRMYLFRDRIVFVPGVPEFLPGDHGIDPAMGNDLCWGLTPRGGGEPDMSKHAHYDSKWGRGHEVSHILFNLRWTRPMYQQVKDSTGGKVEVAHLCVGRPGCVNPHHLIWESASKNRADAARRRGHLVRERRAL
jgi:hypothetical protein